MNYLAKFQEKKILLLKYFPDPGQALQPFFEEILLNVSIQPGDITNALKFLNNEITPRAGPLFAFVWPAVDKELILLGISNEKPARARRGRA